MRFTGENHGFRGGGGCAPQKNKILLKKFIFMLVVKHLILKKKLKNINIWFLMGVAKPHKKNQNPTKKNFFMVVEKRLIMKKKLKNINIFF